MFKECKIDFYTDANVCIFFTITNKKIFITG